MSESSVGLASFQKKYLRGIAHSLRPLVHVGKGGLTTSIYAAVDEQLARHELIKVRLLDPEDKKAMAKELAAAVHAEIAGIVGHIAILYRASEDDERENDPISLPSRQVPSGES